MSVTLFRKLVPAFPIAAFDSESWFEWSCLPVIQKIVLKAAQHWIQSTYEREGNMMQRLNQYLELRRVFKEAETI